MNNNSSKQILLSVIGVAILVVAVVGVSFAFFSYVYNDSEKVNTIETGTIIFNASTTELKLVNVFPTDAVVTNDGNAEDNLDTSIATISVSGFTTYDTGIDFQVAVADVVNNSNRIVPKIVVTHADENKPAGVTFTTSDQVFDQTNVLKSGKIICKGTIAPNTNVGTPNYTTPASSTDANILTIQAFYDKAQYHISDNTKDDLIENGLLQEGYAGTVIPTPEWNNLSKNAEGEATPAYSFRVVITATQNNSGRLAADVQ